MASNSSAPSYTSVAIRMGGLVVEIGTEVAYPDMVSDITHRTLDTFKEALTAAKDNGIDISNMRLITTEYGDDYEEE